MTMTPELTFILSSVDLLLWMTPRSNLFILSDFTPTYESSSSTQVASRPLDSFSLALTNSFTMLPLLDELFCSRAEEITF